MAFRAETSPRFRPLTRAGLLLGFALGGFFDGILLHQILQWHHLLSGVQSGRLADWTMQVMADGLFHLLMYVLAALGLWGLWRARGLTSEPRSGRLLIGALLLGFAAWHGVDALVSHALLGLHHIRMDVPEPWRWDLGWLLVFGGVPAAAGWWLRVRSQRGGPPGALLSVALAATTVVAAAASTRPLVAGPETVAVVLRPGVTASPLLQALGGSDWRLLGSDPAGRVWLLAGGSLPDRWALYRHGAVLVSGTWAPGGCAAWVQAGR